MSNITDSDRLEWLMENFNLEEFSGVEADRFVFAEGVAADNGREDPNDEDYLEGFRQMIDYACKVGRKKVKAPKKIGHPINKYDPKTGVFTEYWPQGKRKNA